VSEWATHTDLHGRITYLYDGLGYAWYQDCNAKNIEGNICAWDDEKADGFSLLGAVYKVFRHTNHWYVVQEHLQEIFGCGFWEGALIEWNDKPDRTYEEVLAFLKQHQL
jgi:hypothetical protein